MARRKFVIGKRQDLSSLSEVQRRLYDKISKNVRKRWPITIPQYYDVIEGYEDTGESTRDFKVVTNLIASKYFGKDKVNVYPNLK